MILYLVVLLQQLRPFRARVFLVAHPGGLLLVDELLGRFELFRERSYLGGRARQGRLGIGQLGDAAIEHTQIPRQLGELGLFLAPRRVLPMQALQLEELGFEPGDRRDGALEAAELLTRGQRRSELLVEPLKLLPCRDDRRLRHAQVAMQ